MYLFCYRSYALFFITLLKIIFFFFDAFHNNQLILYRFINAIPFDSVRVRLSSKIVTTL